MSTTSAGAGASPGAQEPGAQEPGARLRVALAQVPPITGTAVGADVVDAAVVRADRLAGQAVAAGADVLVLPEMHLTGYAIGGEAVRALAVEPEGAASRRMASVAAEHGIAICHGFPERDGVAVYNAAEFIDETGRQLLTTRKLHLFGDVDVDQFSRSSQMPQVVSWRGWGLGLAICYDVEFPEVGRALALAGADLVCVPTANMVGFDAVSRLLVPARAYENQFYLAYANYCGSDATFDYNGLSVVVGPDGEPLASAGRGEELIIADASWAALGASREHNPYLRDRRGDLFPC